MILSRQVAAFAALITSVSASCSFRTFLDPYSVTSEGHVPVSSFNYTGEGGPLHWVGLNPTANWECGYDYTQSPIAIDSQTIKYAAKGSVKMDIPAARMSLFENLGSTVEVPASGKLEIKGKSYKLVQFHFHTPSEHRVDEEYAPMEVHFVFQRVEEKSIAVIGFLIELSPYGRSTPLLSQVFANLHKITTPGSVTKIRQLDFSSVVDTLHKNDMYTYTGSLTTPPCSNKVSWYISTAPLSIDVVTFNAVKKVVKYNARYTQNSLGRENLLEIAAGDIGCQGNRLRVQADP
ncbi:carbonate dehydratase [Nannizzia gypsea CBS 118893]|uniref:carbonic anhydrase n=1 Tax=Arthroderma gypseum (strain ATCC MYA-4604 / CBS 118893) TaxID=535722 RepID=E4V5C4_ARTGP|nr:carbonate dehydratase [Nannizzia gypsea CBS 118893]EFR05198.1 carbonate dehydratase [Nannizzia gypsea CBS 118893]